MASTSPARIDDDLYASARLAGEAQSRSTSQQVVHWARIGREIEASSAISQREIAEVLTGTRSYDGLSSREQALVRAEWSTQMDERRAALDLARSFAAEGRTWVELDDDGTVVERGGPADVAPPHERREAQDSGGATSAARASKRPDTVTTTSKSTKTGRVVSKSSRTAKTATSKKGKAGSRTATSRSSR
jgi:hypothetical protein